MASSYKRDLIINLNLLKLAHGMQYADIVRGSKRLWRMTIPQLKAACMAERSK